MGIAPKSEIGSPSALWTAISQVIARGPMQSLNGAARKQTFPTSVMSQLCALIAVRKTQVSRPPPVANRPPLADLNVRGPETVSRNQRRAFGGADEI